MNRASELSNQIGAAEREGQIPSATHYCRWK
jgi:hypothetical protein